jgi:N-acetylglucosamine-6-phosphate deacetylase
VAPVWPGSDFLTWPWVAPGLFDLQVNGYGGIWFSSPTVTASEVATAVRKFLVHGVTCVLPTLITNSHAALLRGFQSIAEACHADPLVAKMVVGCHLEGPWLSSLDGPRGAHPREHIRPADWHEFSQLQDASGGRIRLVTIAPEIPGALDFIRRAVAAGVTISIGHTAATTAEITAAVDQGAKLSTHLGNGCHLQLPRHPNPIWDQLGESRLAASLITDGHHIPPAVVRAMVAAKGWHSTIITCDASGWAGCGPGQYTHSAGTVEVLASGKIVVAGQDQILAGSSATTEVCVARAVEMGACTLRQAIDMACRNPCRLLGLPEYRLMSGDQANLMLFRQGSTAGVSGGAGLRVIATVVGGQLAYGQLPNGPVV